MCAHTHTHTHTHARTQMHVYIYICVCLPCIVSYINCELLSWTRAIKKIEKGQSEIKQQQRSHGVCLQCVCVCWVGDYFTGLFRLGFWAIPWLLFRGFVVGAPEKKTKKKRKKKNLWNCYHFAMKILAQIAFVSAATAVVKCLTVIVPCWSTIIAQSRNHRWKRATRKGISDILRQRWLCLNTHILMHMSLHTHTYIQGYLLNSCWDC